VEEVLVGGPRLGGGLDDGDTVLGGVLEQGGSAGESVVELGVSPGGNDLDVGGEAVEGKLESDLVVSFTSASVRDKAGRLDKCPSEADGITHSQPSRRATSIMPRAMTGRASEVPRR
jgi:hypothetical protein